MRKINQSKQAMPIQGENTMKCVSFGWGFRFRLAKFLFKFKTISLKNGQKYQTCALT